MAKMEIWTAHGWKFVVLKKPRGGQWLCYCTPPDSDARTINYVEAKELKEFGQRIC